MKLNRPLQEFVAAAHSPFHADGSLAPEVVPVQASFLAQQGIRTVFITGTTGECHSLTCAERLTLFRAWADAAAPGGITVIAHVGANSLDDARTLAARARELQFAAISALAPSYFKPADVPALVDWCAAVAAAAPDLPFYYYDIPVLTNVSLPNEAFLVAASARIPSLAGIKFTNPDLVSYRRSLDAAGDRFDLPWGVDEALLGALAMGARGCVGSTYNWAPKLFMDMKAAFDRGDLTDARRQQSAAIGMIDALAAVGFMGAGKALMMHLGVPVGPARPPLANPTPDQMAGVLARLRDLGFERWGARFR